MKRLLFLLVAILCISGPLLRAEDDFGLLIFNHRIAIGMTFGNVQAAWGKPRSVDRSKTSSGVTEYWFFEKGVMVVFENGRVSSIHE